MHGHWLKGYLRDGKEIEGGGGSGGGALLVTLSGSKDTADKTFGEIGEALEAGRPVYVRQTDLGGNASFFPVYRCLQSSGAWVCEFYNFANAAESRSWNQPEEATAADFPYFKNGGIS